MTTPAQTSNHSQGKKNPSRTEVALWTTEYRALRDETLARMKFQHQLTIAALVAPGTVLAIGLKVSDPDLILLYPLFAMLLTAAWAHHEFRKRTIGYYILSHVEEENAGTDNIGWETYLTNEHDYPKLLYISSRGVFLGTQILAFIAGLVEAGLFRWVPATLRAWINGTPLPDDLSHFDPQHELSLATDHLWSTFLVFLSIVSIFFTVLILRRARREVQAVRKGTDQASRGEGSPSASSRSSGGHAQESAQQGEPPAQEGPEAGAVASLAGEDISAQT